MKKLLLKRLKNLKKRRLKQINNIKLAKEELILWKNKKKNLQRK